MGEHKIFKANGNVQNPSKPDIPTCANCPFYFHDPDDKRVPVDVGECRYEPNAVIASPGQLQGQIASIPIPRPTRAAHWCGLHPLRAAEATAIRMVEALDMFLDMAPEFKQVFKMAGVSFPPETDQKNT